VRIHRLVDRSDPDFLTLKTDAEFFAGEGSTVLVTPKRSRGSKFDYADVYGSLAGTRYEGKCPDLLIDGKWYEHEGFTDGKPKRAFSNMLSRGLKQSDRLIIDRPGLTDRYMLRSILDRVNRKGQAIEELWIREPDGTLSLLFRKTDG